ncbi:MAG: RNA methyltransferase [Blastocatellales bacterium]|nr:RNA methyltransferase [Blastocatellales bacterium]
MHAITSPANPNIKLARRVRDGREDGLVFVEGERLVLECLDAEIAIHSAYVLPAMRDRFAEPLRRLLGRGCPVFDTHSSAFAAISDTVNSQGIVVIASRPGHGLAELFGPGLGGMPLIVGMDRVADPGNLGTIVRTAEGAGASGIAIMRGSTSAFSPKALRAAMGSAFRMPIVCDCEAAAIIAECRARGLTAVAATAGGAVDYSLFDWRVPAIVFFGQEAHGISPEILEMCDTGISIPLCPPVESLNVAAAAAAILFEAARRRRQR